MNQPTQTIEVHNVWAIYGLEEDGSHAEQPLAMPSRPQDWGDKDRWTYHHFRFEWPNAPGGKHWVNHFHGWTDLKLEPGEYPQYFASLVVQIFYPGTAPQLCGRDFLHPDDFWSKKWGPQLPFYDGPDQVFPGDTPEQTEPVDEAEALAMMTRVFKEPTEVIIQAQSFDLFQLIGLIQFATRGLPPNHNLHPFARKIGDQIADAVILATGEPELARYIQLGWNPTYDVVQPNPEDPHA